MKMLRCRDAGYLCDFKIRGETITEVMKACAEHLKKMHGIELSKLAKDEKERIKSRIKGA